MINTQIEIVKKHSDKDNKDYTNYILHLGDFTFDIMPKWKDDYKLFSTIIKKMENKKEK